MIETPQKPPHYIHLHKVSLEEAFEVIGCLEGRYEFGGFSVKVSSKRLRTFKGKGVKCAGCGIEGAYFSVDRFGRHSQHSSPHLNLYGINQSGEAVLMTHDHIIPKSKGGLDDLSNTQTMCVECNVAKGDKL